MESKTDLSASSKNRLFRYIYSSSPLTGDDFSRLKYDGIFKNYFADNPFRKKILEKLEKSFIESQGGVFLVSGYRGIGKTTFLNYILKNLEPTHFSAQLNLSEIRFDFKLELIGWVTVVLKETLEKERNEISCRWFKRRIRRQEAKPFIDLTRLIEECKGLFEAVFFEQEISRAWNASFKWWNLPLARWNYKKTLRLKENLFFYESRLKKILKKIKEQKILSKRFIFVLDELDKLPFSSIMVGRRKEGETDTAHPEASEDGINRYFREIDRQYQKMEWLLKMLADIKSFLFESGAVFVLVVNKDVYDCWKHRHSQEDLFMNLVTNVEYLPNYTKEEMELSNDFPLVLAEDADVSYPFSSHAIKKYFQTTMYYESYGNPRLYFQNLSRQLKDEEIRISRDEAGYLVTKYKLFELNELVYNYVYKNDEQLFGRFLFGIDEIKAVFERLEGYIDEVEDTNGKEDCGAVVCRKRNKRLEKIFGSGSDGDIAFLFAAYYLCLGENRYNLREFWRADTAKKDELSRETGSFGRGSPVYNKLEAFLTILKQHDVRENYPYTNYVIRRLTDFLRIIEEKHFVSIEDIYEELCLQEFEKTDTVGRYFINLLIPLLIVILRNNGVLKISGNYLHYAYDYNSSIHYYHEGCEAEFNGDFREAFDSYNRFLKAEPFHLDAHHRKLRLLYYTMKLGYYDEKIDAVSQWFAGLLKMKKYFPEGDDPALSDDWHWANYLFSARYFLLNLAGDDPEAKKYYLRLLGRSSDPDSGTIETIYTRAVERDPLNANIKMWKGYFLMHEGRYAAALDLFRDARRLYSDPLISIREAYAHSRLDDNETALKLYLDAFYSTTSWLLRAVIIIQLSKLDNRTYSDIFWNELKDFIGRLKMKPSSDGEVNYYFVLKALYRLCNNANNQIARENIVWISFKLNPNKTGYNRPNDQRYKVFRFYRNKTF